MQEERNLCSLLGKDSSLRVGLGAAPQGCGNLPKFPDLKTECETVLTFNRQGAPS